MKKEDEMSIYNKYRQNSGEEEVKAQPAMTIKNTMKNDTGVVKSSALDTYQAEWSLAQR